MCRKRSKNENKIEFHLPSYIHPNDVSNGPIDQSNYSIVLTVYQLLVKYYALVHGFVLRLINTVNHLPKLYSTDTM